jgi:glutaredoxin
MEIKINTTPGCQYCTQAKKLFEKAGYTWEEVSFSGGNDLKEQYPNATAFPWIIIDGKEVGGLVETARLFLERGLVTSKKNERFENK